MSMSVKNRIHINICNHRTYIIIEYMCPEHICSGLIERVISYMFWID